MKMKNSSIRWRGLLLTVFVFLFSSPSFSSSNSEKEFNVSEMIMHHVKDAHEWHLWGPEHGGTSIYLPVILIDKCFS